VTVKRRLVALAAVVVALAALSLGFAQKWGWSTPFVAIPAAVSYHDHRYYIDTNTWNGSRACFASSRAAAKPIHVYRLPKGYTPLRRNGEVFGYFTNSKPILLPHYEWTRQLPFVILVRDGGCLRYYTLPPSYGP
jgi:hypothetical protein